MTNPLSKESPAITTLLEWWSSLPNDKGTRATLRRCKTPEAVMLHPAYARLHHELAEQLSGQWNWEWRLACVLGVIVHIERTTQHQDTDTVAKQMGGTEPIVSELRFRRLLQCTPNDLYPRMIRLIKILGKSAALTDLIESVYFWNDRTKRRWAMDYFSITPGKKKSA